MLDTGYHWRLFLIIAAEKLPISSLVLNVFFLYSVHVWTPFLGYFQEICTLKHQRYESSFPAL
jgi:hypothetical protein